ncbi:MAG: tetratricopeptide repeat protein [Leptolyngbyaceae cyanobacterium]
MEQFSSQYSEADLNQLFIEYREALQDIFSESQLTSRQTLRVLRTRDRIQEALSKISNVGDDYLDKLVNLDLRLKENAISICQAKNFEQIRQNLDPPKSYWWWYLESSAELFRSKSNLRRFDWLWNVCTVACLVIATSFITQTAKAFSTEGFDFLGTLSTISQGAGLVFVAGGALTDKGKQAVSRILSSVRIPESLHAEATFAASLLLLIATYGVNQNLHVVGNWYFQQARHHEHQGEFSQAFQAYRRSLNFSPDDYKTHIAVGFLYEKLGNFDQAIEEYQIGSSFGIPEFLNAQARAMLMGELQKNDWQGGIDSNIIREAENLLDRADKSIINLENRLGETRVNPRLSADIRINQAIAKMARVQFNGQLNENAQTILNEIADDLYSIKSFVQQKQSDKENLLTAASTIGEIRTKCFYQKAFSIGWLSDSPIVYGLDYAIQQDDELNTCWLFRADARLSTTPDAFFLTNHKLVNPSLKQDSWSLEIKDIASFSNFIYQYPVSVGFGDELPGYASKVILSQEPDVWLSLAEQLSQSIQEDFVGNSDSDSQENDEIVWRFLLRKDGQTIAYFAYDDSSRVAEQILPFATQAVQKQTIKQLGSELREGGKVEFVDFKIVLSRTGKVLHILPWQMAYTTVVEQCKEQCGNFYLNPRVRSVFQSYTPNLSSPAELSALESVIRTNSFSLAIDTSEGAYLTEPAIFKIKISADGQIVDYQAVNQIATQKFGKRFPLVGLESSQFPELQKFPYVDFKLEHQGLINQISPW